MRQMTLIAKATDVNDAWLAPGNEVFDFPGGRFVRNRDLLAKRDSNHVQKVRASTPDAIEVLFRTADREYADFPYRAFYCEHRTPAAFQARLLPEGYERQDALH